MVSGSLMGLPRAKKILELPNIAAKVCTHLFQNEYRYALKFRPRPR